MIFIIPFFVSLLGITMMLGYRLWVLRSKKISVLENPEQTIRGFMRTLNFIFAREVIRAKGKAQRVVSPVRDALHSKMVYFVNRIFGKRTLTHRQEFSSAFLRDMTEYKQGLGRGMIED